MCQVLLEKEATNQTIPSLESILKDPTHYLKNVFVDDLHEALYCYIPKVFFSFKQDIFFLFVTFIYFVLSERQMADEFDAKKQLNSRFFSKFIEILNRAEKLIRYKIYKDTSVVIQGNGETE